MKITIIGGGWSGVYTAYQLKKIYGNKHDIIILEKEKTIGGKCKDLMDKYPGGAIQFANYKYFCKVLQENDFRLVKKIRCNDFKNVSLSILSTILVKVQLYRTHKRYDNLLVSELFSADELHTLKIIIENYGYKEMTMFYLYQHIDSCLHIRTVIDILSLMIYSDTYNVQQFLETSIYKLMLKMTKDINIITNYEVKYIEKKNKKYTICDNSNIIDNIDIIVFAYIPNKNLINIVPKNVIKECNKLTYTKYASALLNKTELEILKNDILFFCNIIDDDEYIIAYFYDVEKLSIIPDNRKNIINNYFPRFQEPYKSQFLINQYQGQNNIFYTGGYLSFELTESICVHIETIVIPEMKKYCK
jgi:protoporphyrinogen oxidase